MSLATDSHSQPDGIHALLLSMQMLPSTRKLRDIYALTPGAGLAEVVAAPLAGLSIYEQMFVLAAVAFNLLIAAILVVQKRGHARLVTILGVIWLLLAIPLGAVFVHYLLAGRPTWMLVYFGLVFVYMLVELLLDYVLHIEFRSKLALHVPYILLEYAALFGLINLAFAIGATWGYVVSVCFWIVMGSLVYVYWDKIARRRRA